MRKSILLLIQLTLSLFVVTNICAQEVVELNMPKLNKIVVKLMFRNGSICDPAGREGLTFATVSMMTQGAAGDLSFGEIQDILYPWAAGYDANVDKEVSVFTFQVPADFAKEF